MTDQIVIAYPHRPKMDGSLDSICLNCLGTLATVTIKPDEPESRHVCHPSFSFKRVVQPEGSKLAPIKRHTNSSLNYLFPLNALPKL